jgi:hypothetical protein
MERATGVRYVIFLLVAGVLAFFLYVPFELDMPAEPEVRQYFEAIEALRSGDVVALATEYSPSTAAELWNIHENTLYHLFHRDVRVIHLSTWEPGPDLAERFLKKVRRLFREDWGEEKIRDVDFTELRYSAGKDIAIINAATSLAETFPWTRQGREARDLPIMQGVGGLDPGTGTEAGRVKLLIEFGSGYPGAREWVNLVGKRYGVRILAGVTSVMAPDLYPYLKSDQLHGLLSGLPGGQQYERLLREAGIRKRPSAINEDMSIQSAMHFLIVGLVVAGNVVYVLSRARRRRRP